MATAIAHTTRNGRPSAVVPGDVIDRQCKFCRISHGPCGRHPSITQAQYDFIVDLMTDRDLFKSIPWWEVTNAMDSGEYREHIARVQRDLLETTKAHASKVIRALLALPHKPKSERMSPDQHAAEAWRIVDVNDNREHECHDGPPCFAMMSQTSAGDRVVPRGSYALHTPGRNHTNDITFYSVWISDDGDRWSVKQYVSDELVRLQRTAQYMVLDAIAKDTAAAATLYGHEIGKCGICHRKLTNDVSRERGIGPICAERWGW